MKGALFTVSSSRLNAFPGQCRVWVSALRVQSLGRSLYRAACWLEECLEQQSILLSWFELLWLASVGVSASEAEGLAAGVAYCLFLCREVKCLSLICRDLWVEQISSMRYSLVEVLND